MSRITLHQVEAFYWTATLGSVQKAADRLSLSQPAVSLRLREFQNSISAPLFERSGRKLSPTQGARELLRNARNVLDAVEVLGDVAKAPIGGTVRIGFAEGFALACLPQIIDKVHRSFPELHPELTVATSSAVEAPLHDGLLDLAYLVEPTERKGFTHTYLGLQPTSWVAARDFEQTGPLTPGMLAKARVISNQPGTIGYRQVVRWFASDGMEPSHLDICSSVAVQAKLIEAGTGIGILPTRMIESQIASGRLKVLDSFPPVQPVAIFLVFRSGSLGPTARALIGCVNETLSEMRYLA